MNKSVLKRTWLASIVDGQRDLAIPHRVHVAIIELAHGLFGLPDLVCSGSFPRQR